MLNLFSAIKHIWSRDGLVLSFCNMYYFWNNILLYFIAKSSEQPHTGYHALKPRTCLHCIIFDGRDDDTLNAYRSDREEPDMC